ncbi:glycosyltransferase family 1 protein [Sphingobium sp. AN558]|uniref:glycosyltransferase family 4 protein n=1 Tax=Sphingobium sp. AN558 TaxID=3133442 RepID=UPI0030C12FEE
MKGNSKGVAFLAYYLRYWPERYREAHRARAANASRFIYVDVSIIFRRDSGTGIQRVVRALMAQLIASPPRGAMIVPVVATKYRPYRAITVDAWLSGDQSALDRTTTVVPRPRDIFLGLELAAHLIPRHRIQLRWLKSRGVRIALFLYDLLPDQSPQYFTPANVGKFRPWLAFLIARADAVICISRTVAEQLRQKLPARQSSDNAPSIAVIPMGGDILNSALRLGVSDRERRFLETFSPDQRTILMVGTVEPRKAYEVALDAMEWLWRQSAGQNVRLVIVGRRGWRSDSLEDRLAHHPETNKRLFRLDDVSDEYLDALYHASSGLLMTSYAEGFGLPVLEALQSKLPVLARDLPVFRELGHPGLSYFEDDGSDALGDAILNWISHKPVDHAPASTKSLTWKDAGARLNEILDSL